MTLDDLLKVPYVANGRSAEGADCYGLARMARVYLFDKPWMAVYGDVDGADKRQMTDAVNAETETLRIVRPYPGALAMAWRAKLCIHIGIVVDVDGKRMILETNETDGENHGPRLVNLRHFEQRFLKVIYYDD